MREVSPERVRLWHSEAAKKTRTTALAIAYRLLRSILNVAVADGAMRLRNRPTAHRLRAHPAAIQHLSAEVVQAGSGGEIGDLVAVEGRLDGYVAASQFESLTRQFRLDDDWDGEVTLRMTSFDISEVARIAGAGDVLARAYAFSTTRWRPCVAERRTITVATPPGDWPPPWQQVAEIEAVLPCERWTLLGG